jgi:hypothetical protein
MQGQHRLARLVIAGLLAATTVALLGCHHGQPEPSAPGYYTGAMKPKGAGTGAGQAGGAATAQPGNQAGAP